MTGIDIIQDKLFTKRLRQFNLNSPMKQNSPPETVTIILKGEVLNLQLINC
ncbi:hypothetical protein CWATWH8502_4664 [Crocosphaera watsonii WH 8502]|uniref:Uncharacterized protein n=4 Tax=Crocosphaera watsonii TaxID=263511 RepID=T2JTL6_CROWT|nr:hypothetical protein CWATWH8502_4664 [Crocosphaera watsonii WH 8502]CCQ58939.1 hypothetical protein CWATWH0005_4826 [Crocosphaera watsonii WH 0005]CCQ60785.1 hypothetical protein CWATWH0401_1984 [Crocosphaera watsonii WH 0401]CCQ68371.1 hypothetical protein CWATWH0402_2142 [Crocosphaera watsonii WH 0402]